MVETLACVYACMMSFGAGVLCGSLTASVNAAHDRRREWESAARHFRGKSRGAMPYAEHAYVDAADHCQAKARE